MEQDTASGSSKLSPSEMSLDGDRSDLLMVHLLRMLCSSLSGWAENFTHVVKDIHFTGLFTQGALGLACESPEVFYRKFDTGFAKAKAKKPNSILWKHFASRFENDFIQYGDIGQGGCGIVVKAKNKLDDKLYAVKKIWCAVKDIGLTVSSERELTLREATAMSKMNHNNVVRYYSAWLETVPYEEKMNPDVLSDDLNEEKLHLARTYDLSDDSTELHLGDSYLYIQMEFCEGGTLAEFLRGSNERLEESFAWSIARQIAEGLQHIHANEVIHGDLKPENIFFDNEMKTIKIGDFGLAELKSSGGKKIQIGDFLCEISSDSGGSFSKKGDMRSFGIIFFQLWYHFGSDDAERVEVLLSLTKNEQIPATWTADFPRQSEILSLLISETPPSAQEVVELFP